MVMRIYEDGIYHPPDMIEKPGGLQIKGSGIRDGRSCSLQAALHHPAVEAAYGDAAHCGTTLHRPVVEPLEVPEDSEYGDTAHCGTALHRPVVEPATEPENPGTGDAALYRQLFTVLL